MNCLFCTKQTSTYHEIFYGRGSRDICIKYGLKIPVCQACHKELHSNKEKGQKRIVKKLKLPEHCLQPTKLIMHKAEKSWSQAEKVYIEMLGETIQKRIDIFTKRGYNI
jgi:hypothetical protein